MDATLRRTRRGFTIETRSVSEDNVSLHRTRRGFTLVELLTVIVIIGILAGLLTVAAFRVIKSARNAMIKSEISQLQMALEAYKQRYGDYPPDFVNVYANPTNSTSSPSYTLQLAAQTAVVRHIRKAFPRYTFGWQYNRNDNSALPAVQFADFCNDVQTNYDPNNTYNFNPLYFDAASALVFWLGGLPANPPIPTNPNGGQNGSWLPAGFNADPAHPFTYTSRAPRTDPFFQFSADRLGSSVSGSGPPAAPTDGTGFLRYYPRDRAAGAPYVYFRSMFDSTWPNNVSYVVPNLNLNPPAVLYMDFTSTNCTNSTAANPAINPNSLRATAGIAYPYEEPNPVTNGLKWRDDDKRPYQIISAGLDENFGCGVPPNPPNTPRPGIPVTRTGQNFSPDGGDFDNLASFADGTLEVEIQ